METLNTWDHHTPWWYDIVWLTFGTLCRRPSAFWFVDEIPGFWQCLFLLCTLRSLGDSLCPHHSHIHLARSANSTQSIFM